MEQIKFKIDLGIITHDDVVEHPFVNISVNGYPKFGEIIEKDKTIEFNLEVEENTKNSLTVEYSNKDPKTDVVFDGDNIIKDKRIEIKSLTINDIELDFFTFNTEDTLSYESFDGKEKHTGFQASKLSWNGRTTLKFTTPVYIWLLENL